MDLKGWNPKSFDYAYVYAGYYFMWKGKQSRNMYLTQKPIALLYEYAKTHLFKLCTWSHKKISTDKLMSWLYSSISW